MAGLPRLRTLLSHLRGRPRTTSLSSQIQDQGLQFQSHRYSFESRAAKYGVVSSRCFSSKTAFPSLIVQPEVGLADEMLDIQASGLQPGQLVTLRAQVYTEDGKYRFLSTAQYKAGKDGTVKAQTDPSLGGSYKGVEPMGLILSAKPAPEVVHKHPRLVKWDVSRPFHYTIDLLEGSGEGQDGSSEVAEKLGGGKVLASKVIERHYLADYVEQIPVNTGQAEGMLFLPKQRGSSDPLPLIVDMRGLLTKLVVDRAATLASHGFAVFAFDYFLPRRRKTTEETVYVDEQAFLDIINLAKEHPRLDETRIGVTASCYGGAMMLNATMRFNLPFKCLVGAGFVDLLTMSVGLKQLDGAKIEPFGPIDDVLHRYEDEQGARWLQLTGGNVKEHLKQVETFLPPVENLKCPLLIFAHGDDQHVFSEVSSLYLKERLEQAGKGHLVDFVQLPGTGHFLESPYQATNTVSSLYDPLSLDSGPKLYYTRYGGNDTAQAARDQQHAWRKIVNFFRKHLEVKEMYRKDWISD